MKKTVLLVLVSFVLFCTANAQEGGFKQAAGDKAFEVNFAPLGSNPVGIAGIQLKSYSSETSAIRLNIFISRASETKILTQGGDTLAGTTFPTIETKQKESSLEIGLRPGIEKHFAGTDRLSPYVGAELDFAKKFHTLKADSMLIDDVTPPTKYDPYTVKTTGDKGFLRFGVNLVAGFNYFFAKKLYIGAEFGFGVSSTMKSKIKVSDDYSKEIYDRNKKTYVEPADVKQGSTFNIGPNVNSQIRVGFLF